MTKYWSFYEPARPKEVKNGIKAKSKRGSIGETWWSKRWVSVLESFDLGARLTRGRSYARKGQVISIDVRKGLVRAKVQGTMSRPYEVTICLKPLSDRDWEKAIDVMATKAVFAAKLLSGEMPKDIEAAFSDAGAALFPKNEEELETDCSCPDWSNPCKHIAAVYYLLAEQFDKDPFLIFKLRGRTKEEIIEALRERRASGAVYEAEATETGKSLCPSSFDVEIKPLEECLDCFWQAGEGLRPIDVVPKGPEVENAVLKRLGDAPFSVGKANLASLLSRA
ncbi:MAG TPA: SWIM zinc finger family protein, partial [Methanotrichaceae archaeon]|nr:SWIM zinc finger family protein [Methanotrichaceae archaeon]